MNDFTGKKKWSTYVIFAIFIKNKKINKHQTVFKINCNNYA